MLHRKCTTERSTNELNGMNCGYRSIKMSDRKWSCSEADSSWDSSIGKGRGKRKQVAEPDSSLMKANEEEADDNGRLESTKERQKGIRFDASCIFSLNSPRRLRREWTSEKNEKKIELIGCCAALCTKWTGETKPIQLVGAKSHENMANRNRGDRSSKSDRNRWLRVDRKGRFESKQTPLITVHNCQNHNLPS